MTAIPSLGERLHTEDKVKPIKCKLSTIGEIQNKRWYHAAFNKRHYQNIRKEI